MWGSFGKGSLAHPVGAVSSHSDLAFPGVIHLHPKVAFHPILLRIAQAQDKACMSRISVIRGFGELLESRQLSMFSRRYQLLFPSLISL